MTFTSDLIIIRIGDITQNFTRSVLERIENLNPDHPPVWGYNSDKCCGLRPVSRSIHNILLTATDMYALFLPNNKSSITGIAKIYISETRDSTNRENGWTEPTAAGITDWNIQINIEKFWDLRDIPLIDSLFSYTTINTINGARLPQASLIYQNNEHPLKQYLSMHMQYITQYMKPTYVNLRSLE
jgi:hypothetical protein